MAETIFRKFITFKFKYTSGPIDFIIIDHLDKLQCFYCSAFKINMYIGQKGALLSGAYQCNDTHTNGQWQMKNGENIIIIVCKVCHS